jgi:hypothetical protein
LTQVVMCTLEHYSVAATEVGGRDEDGTGGREFLENWRNCGGKREMYALFGVAPAGLAHHEVTKATKKET